MKKTLLFLLIFSVLLQIYPQKSDIGSYLSYTNPTVIHRDHYQNSGQYDSSLVINYLKFEKTKSIESIYQIAVNYSKLGMIDSMFKFLNHYVDKSTDDRLVLVDRAFNDSIKNSKEWILIQRKIVGKFIESQKGIIDTALTLQIFYLSIDYSIYKDFLDILELPYTDYEQIDGFTFLKKEKYNSTLLNHSKKITNTFIQILESKNFPLENYSGRYCEEFGYFLLNKIVFSKNEMDSIEDKFSNGLFDTLSYALLKDRFLVLTNKKQMYGSQYVWKIDKKNKKSIKKLYPIIDIKNVNNRRLKMNFNSTLDEYIVKYNISKY